MKEAIERQEGKVQLYYIDVDKFQDVAAMLEISHIPTIILMKDGQLLETWSGMQDEGQVNEVIIKALES